MLSYNMIPIVQDNMNDIGSRVNILTNVSSNAYYGYQPQVYLEEKNAAQTNQTARMDNNTSNMDIQYNNNNNLCYEAMQTENIPRQVNRKRRWDHRDEFVEFKKRRQTESNVEKRKKSHIEDREHQSLLEDILRETHGVSIYHWY
ncbi:uncharacterized protein LOC108911884 isoform X2 [Anoplophora glabripennis]|uniref:uncharacterized protein LOC108911884 isoform X2 n=1 Tax=Anoplophora glabripennis TaxID=217634 RepID=UPI0008755761|nr:uncharacterized protein LOC108911884 isoform X2 [Anoplophora glabripennis]